MVKHNYLRNFLAQNNDPAHFTLFHILDNLAAYLEANTTLIDNSGSIIYEKNNINEKQTKDLTNSYKFPLSSMGEEFAVLTIKKAKLTQLDNVLVEIASGLISIRMH